MDHGHLSTEVVHNFDECFNNIDKNDQQVLFIFHQDAQQPLGDNTDQCVAEVNDVIREGKVPQNLKCKNSFQELLQHYTTSTTPWENYSQVFQPPHQRLKLPNQHWRMLPTLFITEKVRRQFSVT